MYVPRFVPGDEQCALEREIAALPFNAIHMQGAVARRQAIHYGWDYDYDGWSLRPGPELPGFFHTLRERAARLIHARGDDLAQTLVLRYPPGATIGWHRDAPMFGPAVVGVSFGAPCRMRLRKTLGAEAWAVYELALEPGSAYVLSGAARTVWQHSVPAVKELRYSVSFRTLAPSRE